MSTMNSYPRLNKTPMQKPDFSHWASMPFWLILALTVFFNSCSRFENRNKEQPIARVYDRYLYPSDINDIFPNNHSSNDSLLILANFVDKWIKKQLILQKAELNLTDDQKDVSKQLEEYRSSLLLFPEMLLMP